MTVSPTAATALAAKVVCAVVVGHIVNDLAGFLILDERSGRNENDEIVGSCSVELTASAVAAVLGYKFVAVFEGEQCINTCVNAENYISAVTAVASVGTAV
jgi:hypothetical protein